MGQDAMFDPPTGRLSPRLHTELFGALPARLARVLDTPEVAAAVRPLLTAGWRPAQLAARVGALPEPADPVPAVVAFLERLGERSSPAQAWAQSRREAPAPAPAPTPASPEVVAHWAAQARQSLRTPFRAPGRAPLPPPPVCAGCGGDGSFFVTRAVRLCPSCVELLGSGRARLAVTA